MSTWLIFLDCDRFFLDFAIEYVRSCTTSVETIKETNKYLDKIVQETLAQNDHKKET